MASTVQVNASFDTLAADHAALSSSIAALQIAAAAVSGTL